MPTVPELRAEAKLRGLKGYSTMKKGELEELLKKGDSSPATSSVSAAKPRRSQLLAPKDPLPATPVVEVLNSLMAVASAAKIRYVKIGEINVEGGEMVIVAPEVLVGEYNYDKVEDLAAKGQLHQLATGGDGSFAIYEVYTNTQQDNLPREYRIPIFDDPYEACCITPALNHKILEAESLARQVRKI